MFMTLIEIEVIDSTLSVLQLSFFVDCIGYKRIVFDFKFKCRLTVNCMSIYSNWLLLLYYFFYLFSRNLA